MSAIRDLSLATSVEMDVVAFNSIQFISFSKNPLQGYCHMDIEIVNKYNTRYTSNIYSSKMLAHLYKPNF